MKKEEFNNSEPMQRLYRSEGFLQVTGRSGNYKGETVSEVLTKALTEAHQAGRDEVLRIIDSLPSKHPVNEPEQAVVWKTDIIKALQNKK